MKYYKIFHSWQRWLPAAFLVIDGRQLRSMGAMFQDVVDILIDYDVVNALNLDGGSSTSMYYNGEYVNRCSALNGKLRPLPTAFLVK